MVQVQKVSHDASENNSERERAYSESEEDDNEPYIKST